MNIETGLTYMNTKYIKIQVSLIRNHYTKINGYDKSVRQGFFLPIHLIFFLHLQVFVVF